MPPNQEHADPIGNLLEAHRHGVETTKQVIEVLQALGECENAAGILAALLHDIPYAQAIKSTRIQSQVNGDED
jgi:hypothetical protein